MKEIFEDKGILVTGGAGSVGQEIVYNVLRCNPRMVRILDINEKGHIEMMQKLRNYANVRYLLGDIRDKERLARAMEDINVVFHTASLKDVFTCEYNPFEAIKTNISGTQNLIDVALDEEVDKVVFTSSDKAVNPHNVMGAAKLLAERLITAANFYKGNRKTIFFSVRFGNILGSMGSVLPLFKKQMQEGGPITITDPQMTRFVLRMSQAVDLLFQTIKVARGGEIFIFKMPALRIVDLAEVMMEEFYKRYGCDKEKINIEIIGKKPGEKLYEELMTEQEAGRSLEAEDMFIVLPEMTELTHINEFWYANAKPAKLKSYRSDDANILTKHEIGDLFCKWDLLKLFDNE
jgi:UDP-N-acetylglucosamine 4,6-dehydratase